MTNLFRNPDALVDAVRSIMLGEKKKVVETNKNDKSDDGEGLDTVQPKAVKKKFADRKDKDIDNDGDTDSSDEYLHKRRKAISKAVKEESDVVDFDEGDYPKVTKLYNLIPKLKKAYEPMRGKKISVDNANKLSAIMKKFGDNKDMMIQIMKADIPFVSQSAVTNLITKHGMKGAQLNKMMKEDVDLDEGKVEDVLAVATQMARLRHSPKGRDWGKLSAEAAQKLIDIEMGKLRYTMTAGGKWIKEDGDVEDKEVPCADCGKVHEGACEPEDMKEAKAVKEEDDDEKTDAQKNDMDGDGEEDSKKKKKKKAGEEEEAGKPNKIDTEPDIKTSVSEKKDPDGGDENLMMALRKSVSLRGQYDVAFADGKTAKISQKDAQNLLGRLQKEKPRDREALMKSAYKSEKHFKMALKGQIEKKKNPLDLD